MADLKTRYPAWPKDLSDTERLRMELAFDHEERVFGLILASNEYCWDCGQCTSKVEAPSGKKVAINTFLTYPVVPLHQLAPNLIITPDGLAIDPHRATVAKHIRTCEPPRGRA